MSTQPIAYNWHRQYIDGIHQPYYVNSNNALYNYDSLVLLKHIASNSIDTIFADPPYLLSNNGISCSSGKMVSVNKGDWDKSKGFEEDLNFNLLWMQECRRILKPSGTIWISGTNHNIYQCGYLLQKLNFHILNDIAWFKPNAAPNLACTTFAHSHETLLWAKKDRKTKHIFNYKDMKNGYFTEDKIKIPNKQMRSVWSIPTTPASEKTLGKHPTQKPLALLKRIIASSTNANSTILDPFNGSGTTALACNLIGNRKYIGIELESDYLDLTIKKINYNNTNLLDLIASN